MKFFKGFLVFILIAIIIGGVGYIGYSFLFMGGMDHSGNNATAAQTQQSTDSNTNNNQNQQSMQGMQHGGTTSQTQQNSSQQSDNNQLALNQSNAILQSKEQLNKAVNLLNESQRLMSVDPYSPNSSTSGSMNGMSNMQPQNGNTQVPPAQGNINIQAAPGTVAPTPGNNTTINIYPQGNGATTQANAMAQSGMMQNMGATYDAGKMEQLHAGLYKIAVGKALLDQLNSELVYQAETAASNVQNPVQFYANQYNLTVQNKNKLTQALTYINDAANLVNINPYVSANGLVYDKDRMGQLHQSILKLAESVAALNQLNDNFTKQSIFLANTVQTYINNAANTNSQQMNHATMSTGLFSGLFNNINMSTVVNGILILFVIGLVAGIFGFIASLLKAPGQKINP